MKHNRLAALVWISQIQYFIVQVFVAHAWSQPFSLRNNTISDLGNTACGPYGGRFVCSQLHDLMNLSFVLLGLATLSGALLLLRSRSLRHVVGLCLLALGGIGTIMVGLFPENAAGPYHTIGAGLPFALGNIALLLVADLAPSPRWLRWLTYTVAITALLSLVAFVSGSTFLLGNGGFERLTAYPQTVWMILYGLVVLRRKQ